MQFMETFAISIQSILIGLLPTLMNFLERDSLNDLPNEFKKHGEPVDPFSISFIRVPPRILPRILLNYIPWNLSKL